VLVAEADQFSQMLLAIIPHIYPVNPPTILIASARILYLMVISRGTKRRNVTPQQLSKKVGKSGGKYITRKHINHRRSKKNII
jgi:hypothetical protein